MRANCVLNSFLYPRKWGERKCSIWVDNCFWIIRSNTLETVGNTIQIYTFRLALRGFFLRQVLYKLILNFQGSTVSLKFWIPCFWSTLLKILEDILSTLVGILPKDSASFEFKLESPFVISDTLISVKWNEDSVETFSL